VGDTVKDVDRLLIVARTYYYLKGEFTSEDIYNFILNNKFGFRSKPSMRRIGTVLSRSSIFTSDKVIKDKKVFKAV